MVRNGSIGIAAVLGPKLSYSLLDNTRVKHV